MQLKLKVNLILLQNLFKVLFSLYLILIVFLIKI